MGCPPWSSDPDGEPAVGARLTLWHAELQLWRAYPVDAQSGAVEVTGLTPGTVHLGVRAEDHPWLDLDPRTLEPGDREDLGRLELSSAGFLVGQLDGLDDAALGVPSSWSWIRASA